MPTSYNSLNKQALVFNFHGYGSNANEQMRYGDLRPQADANGFILVHPEGLDDVGGTSYWNMGGWSVSVHDDVKFIDNLINLLMEKYSINAERIYSTGMSNGGFFSFLLACQSSEKFAAVASVTGSMTIETFNNCNPQREVPVLQLHGTQDPIVQYYGNSSIGSIGISQAISYWKTNNYCSNDPVISQLNDSNPNDNFWIEKILYDDGYNGSVVEHYKVYGGEHVWFNNQDINSSELIWEFFSNYDLNGFIN